MLFWISSVQGVAASPAAAQGVNDTAIARQLFTAGVAHAEGDRWTEAEDAFERSLRLAPRPVTRYNLAGAQAEAGHVVAAIENYRRFVREARDARYDAYRTHADEELERLLPLVGRMRLEVTGLEPDDQLTLDGYELDVAAVGVIVPLDPGGHEVAIERHGATDTTRFEIVSGETQDVELIVAAAAVQTTASETTAETSAEPQGRSKAGLVIGVVSAVIVAAGLGVGAYLIWGRDDAPAYPATHGPFTVVGF
ncbi:MAG: tetratricopeptide (TPR) repeat protein [Polyangiales bacterium]|jgi:tetratricopeptide (TPR) repeat protein